jgi:hypothetical protein
MIPEMLQLLVEVKKDLLFNKGWIKKISRPLTVFADFNNIGTFPRFNPRSTVFQKTLFKVEHKIKHHPFKPVALFVQIIALFEK